MKKVKEDISKRDMIKGDAESRSHWVTYALGTKGAGALTKTGVATTKTAVQKSVTTVPNTMNMMNTMQSSRLAQLLPYWPRTQVALPGGMAFNVINGPVLKENLFMQAEKLPNSGGSIGSVNGKGNVVRKFAGEINANNIPNMSRREILDGLPSNWRYTENSGFIHVRDANENIRMRIDPPDKVTKYDHIHLFDENGHPIDVNLNTVDRKSPEAHIPYKK